MLRAVSRATGARAGLAEFAVLDKAVARLAATQTTPGRSPAAEAEAEKFSRLADEWWNASGPFAPLHALNPLRTLFIKRTLCQHMGLSPQAPDPLKQLKLLDVGCGGGILAESLARLGASVTGVDPSGESIGVAKAHAQHNTAVSSRLEYLHRDAQSLQEEGIKFDGVIASEVIEHVEDPQHFARTLGGLTREGGMTIISTLNRTPQSYLVAILGAEQVTGIIPSGTHDWNKFLTPEDLVLLMDGANLGLQEISGMSLDLLRGSWGFSDSLAVNYIASFRKGPANGLSRPPPQY